MMKIKPIAGLFHWDHGLAVAMVFGVSLVSASNVGAETISEGTVVRLKLLKPTEGLSSKDATDSDRTWHVGKVIKITGDYLEIAPENETMTARVPRKDIFAVESSAGRSHLAGAGNGLLYGTVAGLVVGLAQARARADQPCTQCPIYVAVPTGAFLGVIAGSIIGVEEWRSTSLPPVTLGSGSWGNGFQLTFTRNF